MDSRAVHEALSENLKHYLITNTISANAFSKESGISPFVVKNAIEMNGKLSLEDAIAICNYLKISLGDLVQDSEMAGEQKAHNFVIVAENVKKAFSKANNRNSLDTMYELFHSYYENTLVTAYDDRLDEIEPIDDICIGPAIEMDELIGSEELTSV